MFDALAEGAQALEIFQIADMLAEEGVPSFVRQNVFLSSPPTASTVRHFAFGNGDGHKATRTPQLGGFSSTTRTTESSQRIG